MEHMAQGWTIRLISETFTGIIGKSLEHFVCYLADEMVVQSVWSGSCILLRFMDERTRIQKKQIICLSL